MNPSLWTCSELIRHKAHQKMTTSYILLFHLYIHGSFQLYCFKREENDTRDKIPKCENCTLSQEKAEEELLRELQITLNIDGDKAEILLHIVHDQALVHDINGSVRHHFLQVIGQRLPSQVNPLDPVIEGEVLEDRSHVGERESAVDDEATLSLGGEAGRPGGGLV